MLGFRVLGLGIWGSNLHGPVNPVAGDRPGKYSACLDNSFGGLAAPLRALGFIGFRV